MRDIVSHPTASAVVRSIMGLAQSLGLGWIAERVETAEQLDYLRKQMSADFQGFLFSPGVPAEDMGELLRAGLEFDLLALPESAPTNACREW